MSPIWRIVILLLPTLEIIYSISEPCLSKCRCFTPQYLDCSNNNFTSLPLEESTNDNVYTDLNMSNNYITVLENDTFKNHKLLMLRTVDLSNNNISHINKNAFVGLNRMDRMLSLKNNNLEYLDTNVFTPFTNLQELYLQGNKLRNISRSTFSPLKNLTILNINCNRLSDTEEGIFSGLINLEELSLMGNSIKRFNSDMFRALPNLKRLHLQLGKSKFGANLQPKPELTDCLCQRKRALDWCKSQNISCNVTCAYDQEAGYDGETSVCNNSLPYLNFNESFVPKPTGTEMTNSHLVWAIVITIAVISLLIISLTLLAIVVQKAKIQTGEGDYSDMSDFETTRGHITPVKDERFRWSLKSNDTEQKT